MGAAVSLFAIIFAIVFASIAGVSAIAFIFAPRKLSPMAARRQLWVVRKAYFKKQRLMNRSEYPRFKIVEEEIARARKGHHVFSQVNLGEILETKNEKAFRAINSKRVDMLIVNRGGWPVLAVEYQGEGHYQGDAADRDAVKKSALEKAGIGYLEIFPKDNSDKIRRAIRRQLGWNATKAASTPPIADVVPAAHFGKAQTS